MAVFHAVARCGGIASASRELGKSAPSVHHDLKMMEREFGRPLFTRVGRSLRLTPSATELYDSISRSIADVARAGERFRRGADAGETLRLAAVSGFGRYRLAPNLFSRANLQQAIELTLGSHEQVLEALIGRRADAAVTYKPVSTLPIVSRPVAKEEYVLLAQAGTSIDVSFRTVEQLPFVTYDEFEYVFAKWFDSAFQRQPERLRRLDHTTELEEALESVACGRGFTIAPADAWHSGPWRSRCIDVSSGQLRPENMIFLLMLPGSDLSEIISLVTETI